MRTLVSCAAAVAVLGFAHLAWAEDDVVLLTNGGRVRGTVLQEDPTQGVRIRLGDGTIRAVKAHDVKQVQYSEATAVEKPAVAAIAPIASTGAIHVAVAGPAGMVFVDGGSAGKTPADVKAAGVGKHKVRVDFEDGSRWETVVLVQAGETSNVQLSEAPPRKTGMMVAGIVSTGLASVALISAFALVGAPHSRYFCLSNCGGLTLTTAGLGIALPISVGLAAIGVPLWVLGSRSQRTEVAGSAAPRWAGAVPRVSVALGDGESRPTGYTARSVGVRLTSLTWSF